jgi:hypothetical protein
MINDAMLIKKNDLFHTFYGKGKVEASKKHAKRNGSKFVSRKLKSNKKTFYFLVFLKDGETFLPPPSKKHKKI